MTTIALNKKNRDADWDHILILALIINAASAAEYGCEACIDAESLAIAWLRNQMPKEMQLTSSL